LEILKKIVEKLVPPILLSVPANLWRYHNWRVPPQLVQVAAEPGDLPPVKQDAFTSSAWLAHQQPVPIEEPKIQLAHHIAVKTLCGLLNQPVQVFDLGGGPAVLYPCARTATDDLDYIVLENARICELGRKIFPKVRFFDTSAQALECLRPGGISLCVSVLQYCLDWKSALGLLVASAPKFVVIGRHYTRDDGPVLYALQRIHGSHGYCGEAHMAIIPMASLIEEMRKLGYSLVSSMVSEDATPIVAKSQRRQIPSLSTQTAIFMAMTDH